MTERRPERFSRGGCWSRPRSGVRIARRIVEDPEDRFESRGIRLVEVVDEPASKSTHPHIPRSHRFVRGGSWRFLGSKNDRERAFPKSYTSENVGIRLVEVTDDPASTPTASESIRVYRGGIWDDPQHARMVYRGIGTFSFGLSYNIGIRLVEEVDE